MDDRETGQAVRVAATADGTLTYLVDMPPEALPAVRLRDLAAAWDAARGAALAQRWGSARLVRFLRPDGSCTDLALRDADAACWADAVDATVGLRSAYGLSLCLRLLALVDLLARAAWTASLVALRRDGAQVDHGLMQLAASSPLTGDAGFDETAIRTSLAARVAGRLAAPDASHTRSGYTP